MTQLTQERRYWGSMTPPKTKAEFFNAVTTPSPTGEGKVATIRLYGPIDSWGGFWGVSAKDVGAVLDALPDSVEQIVLRINSPGGEIFEGLAILNMLRAHKASLLAVVDGLAGSSASFIAAGADETVMSPGTQMVIHSPSGFTWGNAVQLRKDADVLDTLEKGIVEIYTAKAGKKDWATLLAAETWMTSQEAVDFGLADRVAVIPDAGETVTAGDQPQEIVVVLPEGADEPDDLVGLARITPIRERAVASTLTPTPKPPSSIEPEETNPKEDATMADNNTLAAVLDRLGLTDVDTSDDAAILAAVDGVIEQATAPAAPVAATVPEGTTLIDSEVLATLQSDAAAGREARDEQDRSRREGVVSDAIKEGRIAPAARQSWLDMLAKDETATTALIGSLAKNAINVEEVGRSDSPEQSEEDRAYVALFGAEKKEA